MVSETVYFLILMVELALLTIIGILFNILLPNQLYEMVISTVLLLILLFAFNRMSALIPLLYLNWYFFTKLLSNVMNKDSAGVIRFD